MSAQAQTNAPEPIEPSQQQIENAGALGWEYLGDGIFKREDQIGWFHFSGFWKEADF